MKLGCTSYVYPADIVPNVEKLAGLVDNIELLIFEGSERDSLPDCAQVRRLCEIARHCGLSYTVHLPIDIDVCSNDKNFRSFSNDRMEEIVDLTAPLNPHGFVLHLPGGETGGRDWTETACGAAQKLCAVCGDGKLLVENLTYPFSGLEPVFEHSDALLCLDIGHAQKAGDNWQEIYRRFGKKVRDVHFYVHDPDSDRHLGIQNAPSGFVSEVANTFFSGGYEEVLTVEVFGENDFFKSMEIVKKEMENWAKK